MGDGRRLFAVGGCLGRGGFGEVYRATMTAPTGLQSEVALKILRLDKRVVDDAVLRLRDEAHLLARLQHPVLLRVVDLTRIAGRLALVTELVDGADLSDCLKATPAIPLRGVLETILQVGEALYAAHETVGPDGGRMGLVHRDIKPSNIRIGRFGEVKLLDFGIARAGIPREARTDSDRVVGSIPYMAPERFLRGSPRPEGDIFGLGCVLFEAAAGERFFLRTPLRELSVLASDSRRYESFRTTRLLALGATVPTPVRALTERLLAFQPEDRPWGGPFAKAVDEALADCPGDGLRAWCRAREWSAHPATASYGSLQGKTLLEEPIVRPNTAGRGWLPWSVLAAGIPVAGLFAALGTAILVLVSVAVRSSQRGPVDPVPATPLVISPIPATVSVAPAPPIAKEPSPSHLSLPIAPLETRTESPAAGTGRLLVQAPFPIELRQGTRKVELGGDIPEGIYQLYANTGAGMVARANVAVTAAELVVVTCVADPFSCQTAPR